MHLNVGITCHTTYEVNGSCTKKGSPRLLLDSSHSVMFHDDLWLRGHLFFKCEGALLKIKISALTQSMHDNKKLKLYKFNGPVHCWKWKQKWNAYRAMTIAFVVIRELSWANCSMPLSGKTGLKMELTVPIPDSPSVKSKSKYRLGMLSSVLCTVRRNKS